MKDCDCGVSPVADGDRIVGMITDRDIAIRCLAEGKGAGRQSPRGDDAGGHVLL
jgi:CBS domain-containing protein